MLVRPFEHWFSWLNMILGLGLLVEPILTQSVIHVYLLPWYLYTLIGGLLFLAGAASIIGLQWPRRSLSYGWALERTGWLLSAGAWLISAVVIAAVSPFMFVGFTLALTMVGVSALRWWLLDTVEKRTRADTAELGVV